MDIKTIKEKIGDRFAHKTKHMTYVQFREEILYRKVSWSHKDLVMNCAEEMCELVQKFSKLMRHNLWYGIDDSLGLCEEIIDIHISFAVLCATMDFDFRRLTGYVKENLKKNRQDAMSEIEVCNQMISTTDKIAKFITELMKYVDKDIPKREFNLMIGQMVDILTSALVLTDRFGISEEMMLYMADVKMFD